MNKYILQMPVREVGVTKPFSSAHNGVDFGWIRNANQPIYACDDGKVADVFYTSSVGNAIVIQHDYDSGHRWTGYIHLKSLPELKKGDRVKRGQQIALMGNTGQSNGSHLHLYVTDITILEYTWSVMKANVIDGLPLLYCDRKTDYVFASDFVPQWHDFDFYPEPVERDHSKHQVQINSDTRRLRKSPDTKEEPYPELCKRGIYNVICMVDDSEGNDYRWANIRDGFWVSVMSTDDEYQDYRELYRRAAEEITDLKSTMKIYETQKEMLVKQRDSAEAKLKKIREIIV